MLEKRMISFQLTGRHERDRRLEAGADRHHDKLKLLEQEFAAVERQLRVLQSRSIGGKSRKVCLVQMRTRMSRVFMMHTG
jgi:hypothetical protein